MNIIGVIICIALLFLLHFLDIYEKAYFIKNEKINFRLILYIFIVGIIGVIIISFLN
jgi:hypothetical protein